MVVLVCPITNVYLPQWETTLGRKADLFASVLLLNERTRPTSDAPHLENLGRHSSYPKESHEPEFISPFTAPSFFSGVTHEIWNAIVPPVERWKTSFVYFQCLTFGPIHALRLRPSTETQIFSL